MLGFQFEERLILVDPVQSLIIMIQFYHEPLAWGGGGGAGKLLPVQSSIIFIQIDIPT